ncbi:MAG: hypothetical protein IPM70_13755, partial [Proteobacteria bacterium]|nr:hypothetical protein [Pseudomonadota bacterium]
GAGEGGASAAVSRVIVRITPAGRQIYDKVMPIAQGYQAGLLNLMSVDERRVLLDVLQKVHRYMTVEANRA